MRRLIAALVLALMVVSQAAAVADTLCDDPRFECPQPPSAID